MPAAKTPSKTKKGASKKQKDKGETVPPPETSTDLDAHEKFITETYGEGVKVPSHSLKITRYGKAVLMNVNLHRVPETCINFQPYPTFMHMDTFRFSKKLVIRRAYPKGVTVECGEQSFATFKNGILTATMPIAGAVKEISGDEMPEAKNARSSKNSRAVKGAATKSEGDSSKKDTVVSSGGKVKKSGLKPSKKTGKKQTGKGRADGDNVDEQAAIGLATAAASGVVQKETNAQKKTEEKHEWIAQKLAVREERKAKKKQREAELEEKLLSQARQNKKKKNNDAEPVKAKKRSGKGVRFSE